MINKDKLNKDKLKKPPVPQKKPTIISEIAFRYVWSSSKWELKIGKILECDKQQYFWDLKKDIIYYIEETRKRLTQDEQKIYCKEIRKFFYDYYSGLQDKYSDNIQIVLMLCKLKRELKHISDKKILDQYKDYLEGVL